MAPVVEPRRSQRARPRVSYDITWLQRRRRQAKSLDGVPNINQNELGREKQTAAIAGQSLDEGSTDTSMSDSSKSSTRIRVKVSPRSSSSSSEELSANLSATTPSTAPRASRPKARKSIMSVAPKHLRRRTASSSPQQTHARPSVEEGLNRVPASAFTVPRVCHLPSFPRRIQSNRRRANSNRALPFSKVLKPSPMLCETTKSFSPRNPLPCRHSNANSTLTSPT